MEQFQGKDDAPPLHFGVVAIKKGAFESTKSTAANLTFFLAYSYITVCPRLSGTVG